MMAETTEQRMAAIDAPGAAAPRAGEASFEVETVRMDSVRSSRVRWLWPGRVPLGKLTLLAGDPGLGKSFVGLDLAARVSSGSAMPDGGVPELDGMGTGPGVEPAFVRHGAGNARVLLLSAEDDPADSLRPRLETLGADVSNADLVGGMHWVGVTDPSAHRGAFDLSRDTEALGRLVSRDARYRLIVIDPISAYMGQTDSHKNADVRGVLKPLGDLAQAHGLAVVAVTHLNKGGNGGGSGGSSNAVLSGRWGAWRSRRRRGWCTW